MQFIASVAHNGWHGKVRLNSTGGFTQLNEGHEPAGDKLLVKYIFGTSWIHYPYSMFLSVVLYILFGLCQVRSHNLANN